MKDSKWKVRWPSLQGFRQGSADFFYYQDGDKKRVHFKRIGLVALPILILSVLINLLRDKSDTSYLDQSMVRSTEQPKSQVITRGEGDKPVASVKMQTEEEARSKSVVANKVGKPIKYSAKQVIDGSLGGDAMFMPVGTNMIGKLLTAIDTRDKSQLVKVLLPYGGVYQGTRRIDNNSVLFGTAQYAGNGDRVYLRLNQLLSPEGHEYRLAAQALNSKDYSSGLSGDHHSNMDGRIFSTVGLSMIAAGSDVLVEKESLGQSVSPTPKSTFKNAAMAGVSQAAQMEAERRASTIESEEEYVTIESGTELIISLTESFRGESSSSGGK